MRHYEAFGGVSPLPELTRQQASGLAAALARGGPDLPVFVGMRHGHPFLADTLGRMARLGVRRAIGVILAPQRSASSCLQYRQDVDQARQALRERGGPDIMVVYVDDWHVHPGLVATLAEHVREARDQLPASLRNRSRLLFTAHSLPIAAVDGYPYREQLLEGAKLVAQAAGMTDWALVYQSRSGRPDEPWLEPDICDYLRMERPRGLDAVVVCPIGFVCDHIEILWDLDRQAASVARELGIAMARAATPGVHPRFIETLADLVRRTYRRYARGLPLPVVSGTSGPCAVR